MKIYNKQQTVSGIYVLYMNQLCTCVPNLKLLDLTVPKKSVTEIFSV